MRKERGDADVEALQEAYEADPASFIAGEDGKSLIYYNFSLFDDAAYAPYDEDHSNLTGDPYAEYDQSSYENTVAYFSYNFETENRDYYDTFVNYGASEITVSTSATEEEEEEEEDTSTTEDDQNVWLLVSSIVLAIILILVLVLLLLRNLLANLKKRKVKAVAPTYDNKRKRYVRKLRQEESEEEKPEDDVLPTDEDEITEEDIYRVDDEPTAAEPTEGEGTDDENKND